MPGNKQSQQQHEKNLLFVISAKKFLSVSLSFSNHLTKSLSLSHTVSLSLNFLNFLTTISLPLFQVLRSAKRGWVFQHHNDHRCAWLLVVPAAAAPAADVVAAGGGFGIASPSHASKDTSSPGSSNTCWKISSLKKNPSGQSRLSFKIWAGMFPGFSNNFPTKLKDSLLSLGYFYDTLKGELRLVRKIYEFQPLL